MGSSKDPKKLEGQRRAFQFLASHLQTQATFTKEEFKRATGWLTGTTFVTYWPKHYKPFLEPVGNARYHVRETFRPFMSWSKFRQHVSQTRRVVTDYSPIAFDNVLIFEFYLPLANEAHLRTTLDSLFFADTILARLKTVGFDSIRAQFALRDNEEQDAYFQRILSFIEQAFVGYSIFHVSGRFRADKLLSQEEAAEIQKQGRRYLIDETTAVARFIFPCKDNNEADRIRYLFETLFVRSIIQLVNGEDEIWMVESGLRNRVHVWRVDDDDEETLFE